MRGMMSDIIRPRIGANPGTDSQFPANCAGNLVSVPGLRRGATMESSFGGSNDPDLLTRRPCGRLHCRSCLSPAGRADSAAVGFHSLPRQRSEEHTSELQSLRHLVCRLLLEKKK